ncbi:MAG: DUF4832 domain-containing protein [Planctomycetaceae bacterium]|nr:DUF4832 domain-containing protein [Planctomycetaceae bacterium]
MTLLVLVFCGNLDSTRLFAQVRILERGESPIGNPLQGLVPYANPAPERFPHSLEFGYIGLGHVVVGEAKYDWKPIETILNDIASRGNQAVLRLYMEYPGKDDGIPSYLRERGLKIHEYLNENTAPFPPQKVWTPDYENPDLRAMLRDFIQEFGQRYDGDPRLGYLTAGLLGTWGEWHTYPRTELWASHRTQGEVLDAYQQHFRATPVLLRYPAGKKHYAQTENASRPFGYHDDSLCWATLETGREEDDWFFVPALKAAGKSAVNKWQTHPIGGEIRPEVWGKIFDDAVDIPQAQSFAECAAALHLTWTMDTGMFREPSAEPRLRNALREVAKLGYEFYVPECEFAKVVAENELPVTVVVQNHGLAPMYHAWPLEFAAVDPEGRILARWRQESNLTKILPDSKGKEIRANLDLSNLPAGTYNLTMRVVNPLPHGKPVQFANREWAKTTAGALTLGPFQKTSAAARSGENLR